MTGERFNYSEFTSSEQFGELLPVYESFGYMAEHPTGGDDRIAAFGRGARMLMHTEPRFRAVLSDTLENRTARQRPTPPLYMANLTLRSAQHMLRRIHQRDYAYLSTHPQGWVDGITHLLDRSEKWIDLVPFDALMMTKEIRTVVDARYKADQLFVALHPELFPRPIKYLDLGTSAGTGAIALMTGQIKHKVGVNIIVPAEAEMTYPHARLVTHQPVTRLIEKKMATPLEFEIGVGVDIVDPNDPEEREWIRSCYYPTEVAENKNKTMTKFDHLAKMQPENWVPLKKIDCSSTGAASEIREQSGVEKFDLITINTMLNQLTEEERVCLIKNVLSLLSPDGVALASDFAKVDTTKPSGLDFYDVWNPYTYRTMQLSHASMSWEDVFWWSSGRCNDVIVAPSANFLTRSESLSLDS